MNGTPGKKRRWGDGRCAFLAHAEAIHRELASGRSRAAVYDEYRGLLGVGYVQFTRYVKARLSKQEAKPHDKTLAPVPRRSEAADGGPPAPVAPEGKPRQGESTPLPTFHFDPMDAYRTKFD